MAETQKPKKVIQKPINPLAMKPGQNYGSTKFAEKPQIETGTERKD